jgi:hypothetical protein
MPALEGSAIPALPDRLSNNLAEWSAIRDLLETVCRDIRPPEVVRLAEMVIGQDRRIAKARRVSRGTAEPAGEATHGDDDALAHERYSTQKVVGLRK